MNENILNRIYLRISPLDQGRAGDVLGVCSTAPNCGWAPRVPRLLSLSKVPSPNSTLTFRSPFSDLPERGISRFQSRHLGIPLLREQTWLHVSPGVCLGALVPSWHWPLRIVDHSAMLTAMLTAMLPAPRNGVVEREGEHPSDGFAPQVRSFSFSFGCRCHEVGHSCHDLLFDIVACLRLHERQGDEGSNPNEVSLLMSRSYYRCQ